jgi:hypothetical protein
MLYYVCGKRLQKEGDTMFGFSVFLNQDISEQTFYEMEQMVAAGFGGLFTSLHIPEDDATKYRARILTLGKYAQQLGLEMMVDISGEALTRAGFSFDRPAELLAAGITGLRMDYHISNQQIASLSHNMKVSLNASTLTENDLQELRMYQADFHHLEAWHNYYPRVDTGLATHWFLKKNDWLRANGLTIQAFVPGDAQLRGPLYAGLPTLENHRNQHPLACAIALVHENVDLIYIGDGGLMPQTREQFQAYITDNTLLLHAARGTSAYFDYCLGPHVNRQDAARDVIRSANARFKQVPSIRAEQALPRTRGAITIDNKEYLRYMGEIQLVKVDLPADSRVNVVGVVSEKEWPLLDQLMAGQPFVLTEKK